MKNKIVMKFNKIIFVILTTLIVSCGSSERVITDDGKIYEVKGNTIKNNGVDVTENLSEEKTESIKSLVEAKEEAREAAEERKKELEEQKEEQEKIEKEAQERQDELEEQQEAIEKKREEQREARENYVKAKERLTDKREQYEELKEKGKLSPKDEEKWQRRLKKFEQKVQEAKNKLDNIKL